MRLKFILCLALILAIASFGCLVATSQTAPAPSRETQAEQYFRQYLANCGTNEIRCLWFLDDSPIVGMVMTVNLASNSVYTVRHVYNWAEQSSRTRELSDAQALTLKHVSNHLPPSAKDAEFRKSVFVSIRQNNQIKTFQYERRTAPPAIQRIYNAGGGYFYDGKEN